jgi:hypothetical protein
MVHGLEAFAVLLGIVLISKGRTFGALGKVIGSTLFLAGAGLFAGELAQ